MRTFPDSEGESSSLSREWEVVEPKPGLFVSVGGKYTSARVDASKLVKRIVESTDQTPTGCPTTWRPLPWRPEGRYRKWQQQTLGQALRLGMDEETAMGCQLRYGDRFFALLEMIHKLPELSRRFVPDCAICLGELVFCTREEWVVHLDDLLRRRLPLLLVTRLSNDRLRLAAAIAGKVRGWDEERQIQEIERVHACQ